MKRFLLGVTSGVFLSFLLYLLLGVYVVNSQDYKTVCLIETVIKHSVPQKNYTGNIGSLLESKYKIDNRDGEWNCQDRAEYAAVHYLTWGFKVKFHDSIVKVEDGKIIGHRALRVYNNNTFLKEI